MRQITRPLTRSITNAITQAGAGGGAAPAFVPDASFFNGDPGAAGDLTDMTLLRQDSAATVPVTAASDPIGWAEDISGNGNHLTQSTAGSRPLYSAVGAVFDGSDSLSVLAASLAFVGDFTAIVCIKKDAASRYDGILSCQTGAGSVNAYEWRFANTAGTAIAQDLVMASGGSLQTASTAGAATVPPGSMQVLSIKRTGGVVTFKNRVANKEEIAQTVTPTADASSRFVLGDRNAGGIGLLGTIAAYVIIGRALTLAEEDACRLWVASKGGATVLPEIPVAGTPDYSLLLSYGQSLSVGGTAVPVISGTRRFAEDFMFAGGVLGAALTFTYSPLVALAEEAEVISGGDCGETPVSGMAEMLHEQGFNGLTIGTATGFPATAIASLQEGLQPFTNSVSAASNGVTLTRAIDKSFKVMAFSWMQGESDVATATYAADLATLRTDLEAAIKAVTHQTEDVWCLTYQLEAPVVGLRHLAASDTYANIRVAMPMYHIEHDGDGVHLTPEGSKVAGAYFGLAYKAIILDGNTAWQPLKCTGSSVAAQTIDLTYNKSGLAFDTTLVAAQTNQGFAVVDAGLTPLTISSVTIVGGNTVRIVVSSGTPANVYYGFSDPTSGARTKGNLRDSQGDTIVFDGGGLDYPMHNWAVLQSITL